MIIIYAESDPHRSESLIHLLRNSDPHRSELVIHLRRNMHQLPLKSMETSMNQFSQAMISGNFRHLRNH